jgi:hypothetical protein
MYSPLVQLVLRCAHKELKNRNQKPSIAREQFVTKPLLDILDILDTPNQLICVVQFLVSSNIQLLHDLCHFAVLKISTMCISKLIVRTPACCTRTGRAQAVDGNLGTVQRRPC